MDFLYGEFVREVPPHYAPPEVWPEFGAVAQPVTIAAREEVGEAPKGVRWGLWPLTFEEYVGDAEPDLVRSRKGTLARNRVVYWKRAQRRDVPAGWHEAGRPWRIDGVHILAPGDYTEHWGSDAKRHLKAWQAEQRTFEQISFDEYRAAYKKSNVAKKMGGDLIDVLGRKLSLPQCAPHIELWGVRNASGEVVAGTGILYSPTHLASVREAPFVTAEAARAGAGAALMDHWFRRSRERGMRLAVSTHFWQEGEPKKWRGFSQFKSRFGFEYVAYPPALWRFVGGKFF